MPKTIMIEMLECADGRKFTIEEYDAAVHHELAVSIDELLRKTGVSASPEIEYNAEDIRDWIIDNSDELVRILKGA